LTEAGRPGAGRVAFLGPAGTFSEEALRASAPAGDFEAVAMATVWDTVMAVQRGEAERALVPIENSIEGSVAATLDALAFEAPGVRILAEVVHPISHCLIARRPLELSEIERVISHPQATAQCARFLREHLPEAEQQTATSTAEAVRLVASAPEPWAALGSRLSAGIYECPILAEGVEDRPDNLTRFVWLGAGGSTVEGLTPAHGPLKTSIVFWGFNDESPGALVDVLREFADRGVNLTKIESRPSRVRLGHYMFFADLDGPSEDPPVAAALEGLSRRVEVLRVLGSYPALASVS
jgi:prephenate dehydratase